MSGYLNEEDIPFRDLMSLSKAEISVIICWGEHVEEDITLADHEVVLLKKLRKLL